MRQMKKYGPRSFAGRVGGLRHSAMQLVDRDKHLDEGGLVIGSS
jgi:hypothetical protein